jgi:hypothetical protein
MIDQMHDLVPVALTERNSGAVRSCRFNRFT